MNDGQDSYLQTGFLFPPAVSLEVETEDRLRISLFLHRGRESHVIQLTGGAVLESGSSGESGQSTHRQ